ncbi:MAG: hypothetical protein HKL92_04540 [Candidatus Eremiobacteraeota bacterium]|nr:hypothetical protein [Candidatus Eremiobacteraeota bacterium]NNM92590.1 hypothetical protein [Candidatus Eremiobacteraeota bacterium]
MTQIRFQVMKPYGGASEALNVTEDDTPMTGTLATNVTTEMEALKHFGTKFQLISSRASFVCAGVRAAWRLHYDLAFGKIHFDMLQYIAQAPHSSFDALTYMRPAAPPPIPKRSQRFDGTMESYLVAAMSLQKYGDVTGKPVLLQMMAQIAANVAMKISPKSKLVSSEKVLGGGGSDAQWQYEVRMPLGYIIERIAQSTARSSTSSTHARSQWRNPAPPRKRRFSASIMHS